MSIEAGVLIDLEGKPIHWHLPADRSNAYLPDSRDLWDVIWENREHLLGFAHSHPGKGVPSPSTTDITTFSAVERALGHLLHWWITSEDTWIILLNTGSQYESWVGGTSGPEWMDTLRQHSNY